MPATTIEYMIIPVKSRRKEITKEQELNNVRNNTKNTMVWKFKHGVVFCRLWSLTFYSHELRSFNNVTPDRHDITVLQLTLCGNGLWELYLWPSRLTWPAVIIITCLSRSLSRLVTLARLLSSWETKDGGQQLNSTVALAIVYWIFDVEVS